MDNKTQPTPPPGPSQKTAAVPLKKETVRITLRARPGAGMTQPKEHTAPIPPVVNTSPVPRPITTSVTPAGAATSRVPTTPSGAPPSSMNKTGPVSIAPIASKATAPIQLPSSPLPPAAARPATAPVVLPATSPQPASRTTAYVKLDAVPAPAVPGAPRPPTAPRPPGSPAAPRPPGAPTPPPAARASGGAAPAAPRPPGAPPAPGRPPGAPGAPPRPGGAPPMAPTVPLQKAPGGPKPPGAPPTTGPKMEAGASTVPLAKAPGAPPKPPGSGTSPMAKAAPAGPGGTQALPKATVQLAKSTQPMAKGGITAPATAAPAKQPGQDSAELYDEKDPEAGLAPLAIVCSILAAALMFVNLAGSEVVFSAQEDSDASAFKVPSLAPQNWEQENPEKPGTYRSTFDEDLKKIRTRIQ